MRRSIISILLILIFSSVNGFAKQISNPADTVKVNTLNDAAYDCRLYDAAKTIRLATLGGKLAHKINFNRGEAEAHRMIGLGQFYQGKTDLSIKNYLAALNLFRANGDARGLAQTYNNIGNVYRDIDANKALHNFDFALDIAKEIDDRPLIAGLHMNVGIIFIREQKFTEAQRRFEQAYLLFKSINNPSGITLALLNLGVLELRRGNVEKAKKLLIEASTRAKKTKAFSTISSINLSLVTIEIQNKNFKLAEYYRNEGAKYAKIVEDEKLIIDYEHTSFELERARKNYKQALKHLSTVYTIDSTNYSKELSQKIGLIETQHNLWKREQESKQLMKEKKFIQKLNWALAAVILLAISSIVLLVFLVKKKNKSNDQLNTLNQEISAQKEALDRMNKHLEDIIEERTQDLQRKNKKLSEYSSHLSHEIRGPVAAMKGLVALGKEHLLDEEEFLSGMTSCVEDIDKKIMNINHNLQDQTKDSLRH